MTDLMSFLARSRLSCPFVSFLRPFPSFLRRQESIPESSPALGSTQKMDPRLREDDGKCEEDVNYGDVYKRANGGKRVDKVTN